jgi:hypothetical protein
MALVLGAAACTDLADYRGTWGGRRVGDSPALKVGVVDGARATLAVDAVDRHGLHGHLTVDGLVDGAELTSLSGAEADALAGLTFSGGPVRVYLGFVDAADHLGQALALVALYDGRRVEVRLLRGGASPVYAIFALQEQP